MRSILRLGFALWFLRRAMRIEQGTTFSRCRPLILLVCKFCCASRFQNKLNEEISTHALQCFWAYCNVITKNEEISTHALQCFWAYCNVITLEVALGQKCHHRSGPKSNQLVRSTGGICLPNFNFLDRKLLKLSCWQGWTQTLDIGRNVKWKQYVATLFQRGCDKIIWDFAVLQQLLVEQLLVKCDWIVKDIPNGPTVLRPFRLKRICSFKKYQFKIIAP